MTTFRDFIFQGDGWQPLHPTGLQQLWATGSDQKLIVSTTSASLNTFGSCATHVYLQVLGADVRVRFSGCAAAPTSTCGILLAASSTHVWDKNLAACARFVRSAGTDASVTAVALF